MSFERHKKYRVKGTRDIKYEDHDRICISCGHRKACKLVVSDILPRPNTPQKIPKGLFGPQPGTWLGCKMGNHDYYLDYELEPND